MVFLLAVAVVAWMSSSVPSKLIANLFVRSAVSSNTVPDNTLVASLLSLSILHDGVECSCCCAISRGDPLICGRIERRFSTRKQEKCLAEDREFALKIGIS